MVTDEVRGVVVVPARGGEPAVGATETIAETLGVADTVTVAVIGEDTASAWAVVAAAGFADVPARLVEAGTFAPAGWTGPLAELVGEADLLVLPGSADGRDLAPRLAAGLSRRLVSGAVALGRTHALVPRASGRALVETAVTFPVVATFQPGVRNVDPGTAGEPVEPEPVTDFAASTAAADPEVLAVLDADAATMDLTEAPFILGAGAGLGADAVIDDLRAVTDTLDGSLGATRVVTDEGWVSHDRQIGTTGVVVDPSVYIAFGVSGAVQHTAGLGAPDHVITVNTDPHCPMMQLSDLAIVADAPAVVAELRRLLGDDNTEAT